MHSEFETPFGWLPKRNQRTPTQFGGSLPYWDDLNTSLFRQDISESFFSKPQVVACCENHQIKHHSDTYHGIWLWLFGRQRLSAWFPLNPPKVHLFSDHTLSICISLSHAVNMNVNFEKAFARFRVERHAYEPHTNSGQLYVCTGASQPRADIRLCDFC